MAAPPGAEFHRTLGRLARTNAPPGAQDATYIRETVDDIEKQTAVLRAQMQALEQKLQDLENERQFFKPMLSPIRRMPLELLGEIFIHTMDDYGRQTILSRICRVCKSWREAAHLIPRLWMNTTIDPSRPMLTYEGVNSWVGRARGLKRTLTIMSVTCGESGFDSAGVYRDRCRGKGQCHFSEPVLLKILKETPSLEKVTFACPTPQCLIMLSKSLSSRYTASWNSIASIGMMWDSWDNSWENIPFHKLNDFFPKSVRSLELDLPWHDNIITSLEELEVNITPRVLKRLTTLKLTCDWSAHHILHILQYSTNVEALHLCPGGADLEFDAQHPFVENIIQNGLLLPKLKTVRLENVYADSLRRLQYLKMPNVFDINIQFGDEDWSPEEPNGNDNEMAADCGRPFASFLRGPISGPSAVRVLRITNGIFEDDTMLDGLKGLSNLESLVVDNAVFDEDLFTKLSAKAALPNLQTLHLLRLHINPAKLLGLQAFVDKRAAKLKTSRCGSIDCEGAD